VQSGGWNLQRLQHCEINNKQMILLTHQGAAMVRGGEVCYLQLLVQSARYSLSYDGLMNVLEMRKARRYDSGTVRMSAKNNHGEVECATTLTVNPLEDLRAGLRHTSKGQQFPVYLNYFLCLASVL